MFLKISLSVLAVLVIIISWNKGDTESPILNTPKGETTKGVNHVPLSKDASSQLKDECKSYIDTTTDKICVESVASTDRIEKPGAEIVSSPHSTLMESSYPKNSIIPGEIVPILFLGGDVTVNPKSTETNIEPGTIFIPFAIKDCGWFCKK